MEMVAECGWGGGKELPCACSFGCLAAVLDRAQQMVNSPKGKRMLCGRKREQSLNHICCVFFSAMSSFAIFVVFLFGQFKKKIGGLSENAESECRCTSLPESAERFLLLLVLQGCVSFLSLFASSPLWAEVGIVCPLLFLSNEQMWCKHLEIFCLSEEKGNLWFVVYLSSPRP